MGKNQISLTASAIALAAMITPAFASDEVTNIRVYDHTKTMVVKTPTTEKVCERVNVPVYGTTTQQGNASAGALVGMILGAAGGKAVTGNDKGAAMGAIIGALAGADKGAQPKQKQTVVGHREETVCQNVTAVSESYVDVYSHSTIRFYIDGIRYVLEFKR
jgi:uncharacterized membrane protein YebE (DUF533 family)